jgi:hypothetical protein
MEHSSYWATGLSTVLTEQLDGSQFLLSNWMEHSSYWATGWSTVLTEQLDGAQFLLSNWMDHSSYWATGWSIVLTEKLTVPQLLKKFPLSYSNQMFITVFIATEHFSTSWTRWIQLHFVLVHFLRLALWRYISVRLLIILTDLCGIRHCLRQFQTFLLADCFWPPKITTDPHILMEIKLPDFGYPKFELFITVLMLGTYIHIYVHTYVHTYIHTYIHTNTFQ